MVVSGFRVEKPYDFTTLAFVVSHNKNSNFAVNWDTWRKRIPRKSVGDELEICTDIAICKNASMLMPACSNLPKIPPHLFLCLHCIFSGVANVIIFHYVWPCCFSAYMKGCNLPSLLLIVTIILSTASFPCLTGIELSMESRVSDEEKRRRKVICKLEWRWALKES